MTHYTHAFNAIPGVGHYTSIMSSEPTAASDKQLIDAAHSLLGIEPVDPEVAAQKAIEIQDATRQQAAVASGDTAVLGGAIANGAVASSVSNDQNSEEQKKKRDALALVQLLQRIEQKENFINQRIVLMREAAEELRKEADKLQQSSFDKYDVADDLEQTVEVCRVDAEDGELSDENKDKLVEQIQAARKKIGKEEIDPSVLEAMSSKDVIEMADQTVDDVRTVAHDDHEKSHECRKGAKTLDERAEELAKEFKAIRESDRSPAEKEQAYDELIQNNDDPALLDRARGFATDPEIKVRLENHSDNKGAIMGAKEDAPSTVAEANVGMTSNFT